MGGQCLGRQAGRHPAAVGATARYRAVGRAPVPPPMAPARLRPQGARPGGRSGGPRGGQPGSEPPGSCPGTG